MDSARRKRELRERLRTAARSRASRAEAIAAGSDHIVIGRPIVEHLVGPLLTLAFGALEPADSRPTCALEQVEMLVVPGLAFDRSGGRLGRGGGYYDRALASVPVPFVCGLAYAAQIVDLVPTTELDVEMDAVATEQGVVRTGRARRRRGMRE